MTEGVTDTFDLFGEKTSYTKAELGEAVELAQSELNLLRRGWPPYLVKSSSDEFDYALGLKNGTVLYFKSAYPVGSWVCLSNVVMLVGPHGEGPPCDEEGIYSRGSMTFPRGLQVPLSEIAWVADAPWGS